MRARPMACPMCLAKFAAKPEVMSNYLSSDYKTCANCGARVNLNELVELKPLAVAMSGTVVPKYGVLVKATASGLDSGATGTIAASLSVSQKSDLYVAMCYDATNGAINGMAWNGTNLTSAAASNSVGVSGQLDVFHIPSTTAGTGALTFDATTAATIPEWTAIVLEITGVTGQAVDKTKLGFGTGTEITTGNTTLTASAPEILIGAIVYNGSGAGQGSWLNAFLPGPAVNSTNYSVEVGIGFAYVRGLFSAGKTNAANLPWGATLITLR